MRRVRTICCVAMLLVAACAVAATSAPGAGSSVTVSMNVPSAISMANSCTSTSATNLGTILPGSSGTTATGAGACQIGFGSSNDSSMLRIAARDGQGTAMGSPGAAWTVDRGGGMMLFSVERSTSSIAFAAGFYGAVLRTVDGGASWDYDFSALGSGDFVFDIAHAPGSNDDWVIVGGNGNLAYTSNGASSAPAHATWSNKRAALLASGWPATTHINGVAMISASTWVIVGDGGRIARTTDTGASFTTFTIPGITSLQDVEALDATTIYAVGSMGVLLKATNGGAAAGDWTTITHPWCGCWFQQVSIADATHVYMSSNGGFVMRWDGSAWAQSTPVGDKVFMPSSVSSPPGTPNTVFATSTYGKVYRSTDGAATFTRLDTPSGQNLADVDARSTTDVLAVGASEAVVAWDGSSWTHWQQDTGHRALRGIAPDPTDGQKAIAIGGQGFGARTTNSGGSWTTLTTGSSANLNGIAWTDADRVVAVGSGGTILVSDDDGTTWQTRPSGTTVELLAVAAGSSRVLWAVGDGGTILTSTNGGDTWTAQASGVTKALDSVDAADATTVVVGGGDNVVLRSANGGSTWVAGGSGIPTWMTISGVAAVDASTFVVTTRYQDAWRSTDGGATFSLVPGLSTVDAEAVDASGSTVAIVDHWGLVATSRDGGLSWTTQSALVGQDYNMYTGISVVDPNTFWAVEDLGAVHGMDESSVAAAQIADYGAGATFATAPTSGTFGVCLQSLAAAAPAAGWTVDGGTCTTNDADPWKGVPTTATKVATAALGATGTATFVWGMAPKSSQAPGTYRAGIVFEALAPAA